MHAGPVNTNDDPDLTQVMLQTPDGDIDAGLLLSELRQRMTAVIDDWAHGFAVTDYLPWSDVEVLIRGGLGTNLVSAAARYGAELIHNRHGSSELAWQPTPESFRLTDHIENLTAAGIDAGTAVFNGYLVRPGPGEPIMPDPFSIPADAVSAYTTAVALFAVTVIEIERDLLAGATIPQPDEPASTGWIAQQTYALVARQLHRVRARAPETLSPWIDEASERDYVETAGAVIDWARHETDAALGSVEAVVTMQQGPDPEDELSAARFIAEALGAELNAIYDRVDEAVRSESFRQECTSQQQAIEWPLQLIDGGIAETLDTTRRAICTAWVRQHP